MSKRHIAFFTRYLSMGGVQRVVVRLANEFADRGHEVDIIVAKGKGALAEEVNPAVRIIDFGNKRVWASLIRLTQYLHKSTPDVLLSMGQSTNIVAAWAKAISPNDTKVFISARTSIALYAESEAVWYKSFVPSIIRWSYPLSDGIIAVSGGVAQDLIDNGKVPPEIIDVVYNPVVGPELQLKAQADVSNRWLKDENTEVILSVGRLAPEKNYNLLLRAFAQIAPSRNIRLVIIGDGTEREKLKTLARELQLEDQVELTGFMRNPYAFMSKASVFVLSSNTEGFGNVLVEALACGCPVVSTDCPSGPREILEGGKWGRLVPVNDEEALAEAMFDSLADTYDPERLRRRAMDFSVERAVDGYLKVLFPDSSIC
jgi:glycosyltransferase involved in cell wall biosynthesis